MKVSRHSESENKKKKNPGSKASSKKATLSPSKAAPFAVIAGLTRNL